MKTLLLVGLLAAASTLAQAQSVSMSGKLGDKALLIIDGAPKTLAVGASAQGVRLLSVNDAGAVVEVGGKRVNLAIGAAQVNLGGSPSEGGGTRIVLSAGHGGHFLTDGSINGKVTRFMVDTGATTVAMSRAEAEKLGVDWRKGQRGYSNTAGGVVETSRVQLASVRVGDVTIYNVEASVVPASMPFVLLGNSYLSRFQMRRENDLLTLDKRF
jgi:aspartyl protease family protein